MTVSHSVFSNLYGKAFTDFAISSIEIFDMKFACFSEIKK